MTCCDIIDCVKLNSKCHKIAENECWTDIIDVKNIDESKIDFVHSCSIERLKSSFDASSIIDCKNLASLGFAVTVFLILIIYLLPQANFDAFLTTKDSLIFLPIIISIIGFFVSAVTLILNSMTATCPPLGQEPKNIFNKKVMDSTLKSIKSGQILSLQKRIDESIRINERKAKKLNIAFWTILCSTSLSLISLLVKIILKM